MTENTWNMDCSWQTYNGLAKLAKEVNLFFRIIWKQVSVDQITTNREYDFSMRPNMVCCIQERHVLSFRKNNLTHISCSQFCAGYLQADIASLPSNMADDFELLCAKNSCAFPHLYRSQPGEVSAPPLASDLDVR